MREDKERETEHTYLAACGGRLGRFVSLHNGGRRVMLIRAMRRCVLEGLALAVSSRGREKGGGSGDGRRGRVRGSRRREEESMGEEREDCKKKMVSIRGKG